MALPTYEDVTASFLEARTREFDTTTFMVGTAEYRRGVFPGLPGAWDVWVSDAGDLVIDTRDGRDIVRLRAANAE